MGFQDWSGWDRLDDLDRRLGLRRPPTEASVRRSERFLWAVTVMMLVAPVVSAFEHHWLKTAVLGALVPLSVATNRRSIKNLRRRAGLP